MSEVNVRLKHNFEDSDKLFRILFAAIKIGKPASKRKIADVADISSQLVDYHIDKFIHHLASPTLYVWHTWLSNRDK